MPIYMPNGQPRPTQAEPQQSAVVVQTADGKTLAFPQVAIAMLSPDALNLIAEAVFRRMNGMDPIQPNPEPTAEMTSQDASA